MLRRSLVVAGSAGIVAVAAAVLAATFPRTGAAPSDGPRNPRPARHYVDLVAGSADAGYQDGDFRTARFQGPAGIAASPDGKRLYVADSGNHRIRAIHLDERNRVSTVAGSGRPGHVDGPALNAEFESPTLLVLLAGGRIAVFDGAIRLVDLGTGSVSTLLEASRVGRVEGLAATEDGSVLYLSESDGEKIRSIDVATREVSTVCAQDPRLAAPGLLCMYKGDLCASDRGTGAVSRVRPGPGPASIEQIGTARHPRGLAASGDVLYALQGESQMPLARVVPQEDATLLSLFGESLENGTVTMAPFLPMEKGAPIGMAADPMEDRRLFVTSKVTNGVVSVRDYDFLKYRAADSESPRGLLDFDYPARKPPRTFRILITGDSHIFSAERQDNSRWGGKANRMEVLPKKLEAFLNSMAALDDRPLDYQVLTVGQKGDWPWLWPYYEVPKLARMFDVDLVLLTICPHFSFDAYFQSPLTQLGIPERGPDPEYRMKPAAEKVTPGLCAGFFERARRKGLARSAGTDVQFLEHRTIYADPELRPDVLEMYGRPIRLLARELSPGVRTSLLYLPPASHLRDSIEHELWQEVARGNGAGFVDLESPFETLRFSYYPFSEIGGSDHLTGPGNSFTALLLARELIQTKAIPF